MGREEHFIRRGEDGKLGKGWMCCDTKMKEGEERVKRKERVRETKGQTGSKWMIAPL